MQGKVVEVATGRKVLLFDEEDLQDTIKPASRAAGGASSSGPDPELAAGINRYLQKTASSSSQHSDKDSVAGKTSAVQRAASAPVPDEEHSGITDDELEGHDDGEPDYDFIGRGTLKASNQALAEVMAEVKGMRIGKASPSSTASAKGSTAAAPKPKGMASTPPKPPVKKP